jgi:hypothetical protein
MPTGLGRVIPKADPTRAAVGQVRDAAVGEGSPTVAGAPDTVGAGDDDPVVVPPHAVRAVTQANALANRNQAPYDTAMASLAGCGVDIKGRPYFQLPRQRSYSAGRTERQVS